MSEKQEVKIEEFPYLLALEKAPWPGRVGSKHILVYGHKNPKGLMSKAINRQEKIRSERDPIVMDESLEEKDFSYI